MEGQNLQSGSDQQGQSEIIIRNDEKIEVEIREILRIRPQDFQAHKSSFEDWANNWQ
jgi:hypothetical protein